MESLRHLGLVLGVIAVACVGTLEAGLGRPGDRDDTADPSHGDGDGDGDGDGETDYDASVDGDGDGDGDGDLDASMGDGDGDGDSDADDAHQRCVNRINEYRASIGLSPLERWVEQEPCSDDQSKRDQEGGGAHGNFGDCGERGQNTCPNWGGGIDNVIDGCLQAMWDEGPPDQEPCEGDCFQAHGHYLNMANPGNTKVACGFHTDASGRTWSNQNFR